jgi:hypothetical protein
MTQPSAQDLVFTMKVDTSDLRRLLASQGVGGPAGAALGGASAGAGAGQGGVPPGAGGQGIFKPLALLFGIEKALGGILKNSAVANTYMGAMGKMFGAAIDILLIPFIPLFNLLMVGISKLIMWLISSGYLEKMTKIMEEVAKNIAAMARWLIEMLRAIKDLDFGKVGSLIADAVKATVKEAVTNPTAAAATAGTLALGYLFARNFPLLGRVVRAGEGLVGLGFRMFGIGGKAAKAEEAMIGIPTAGKGGLMGTIGQKAMIGYFGGQAAEGILQTALPMVGVGQKKTNVLAAAGKGAIEGGAIGSMIMPGWGTAIGAGIGAFAEGGMAWMKNKQQAQQQGVLGGGVSMVNSNNTINFTQNNSFAGGGDYGASVNQAVEQIEKRTGYVLAGRSIPQTARVIQALGGGRTPFGTAVGGLKRLGGLFI